METPIARLMKREQIPKHLVLLGFWAPTAEAESWLIANEYEENNEIFDELEKLAKE